MKHPLVAVGIVGAFVGITSLNDLDVEEMLETYHPHWPHLGKNMDDYNLYLEEHGAFVPERELRMLRSYKNGEPYTVEFVQPDGVRTFEYTGANTFALYIPDTALGSSFTSYTGSAYGAGERSATCIKDDRGFVCEPSRVFGTLCDISFLQGDDAFTSYPEDCGKQRTYAIEIHHVYTALQNNPLNH